MVAMASSQMATITLPTDRQILITREFDAPKELVYQAWTTPQLIKRWWSGEGYHHAGRGRSEGRRSVAVRAPGPRRVRGRLPRGVPRDRDRGRLVFTEVYEGASEPLEGDTYPPGEEEGTINTATFDEVDGRTTLSLLVECPSKDVRDAIMESGMETGMQEGWAKLEQVARSLR